VAEIKTAIQEAIMPSSTPTPASGNPSYLNVPGALYDLSGRISAANAVASCALDALSMCRDAYADINHAGNLIAAIQSLLDLAGQDAERLESQLKGA
jgi:hypothetical protein